MKEISYEEFDKQCLTIQDKIKFAKENNGRVSKWKLGNGFKPVITYNVIINYSHGGRFMDETSEECILLVSAMMCKKIGIDYEKVYKKTYPDKEVIKFETLMEWRSLCTIPSKWNKDNVKKLLDDLTDINYHQFTSALIKEIKSVKPELI